MIIIDMKISRSMVLPTGVAMPTWAVEHDEATFRISLLLYNDKKAGTMSHSANVIPSH